MKKIKISIILLVALLSGCTNDKFKENYEKMQVSNSTINGYQLDLRIYGTYNNKIINEIVKIDNYLNKQYRISILNNRTEEISYIIDNIKYVLGAEKEYVKTDNILAYSNPNLYLEGLNYIKNSKEKATETIAEVAYNSYEIEVKASKMKEILANSIVSDLEIVKNAPAKVLINKNDYVYKIVYYLNEGMKDSSKELTLNATYFRINAASEIRIDDRPSLELPVIEKDKKIKN